MYDESLEERKGNRKGKKGGMGQVKVGLEWRGRRGGVKGKESKSGMCYAEERGAEEAILMQGGNQVLEERRKCQGEEGVMGGVEQRSE